MTELFFLIHRFRSDFWELKEGLLVSFPKDHVFVIIILFKIDVGWAALVDDPSNMLAISLVDVRRHLL